MTEDESSSLLSQADGETVDKLFKLMLGRPINNQEYQSRVHNTHTVEFWIQALMRSEEFKTKFSHRTGAKIRSNDYIADSEYRAPRIFPRDNRNDVLITGSCLTQRWLPVIGQYFPNTTVHHVLFNNASDMEDIAEPRLRQFDFQIAQIPTRSLVKEAEYFHAAPPNSGDADDDPIFRMCLKRLTLNFDALMKYNRQTGLPVFVLNFATPQCNPLGVLMPRYDKSNYVFLIERLNRALFDLISQERNVFFIDFDAICATFGKRHIMDDLSSHINHGSFIGATNWPEDIGLTPYGAFEDLYEPRVTDAMLAIFNECLSGFYALSPTRKIKIVIFDLDGTLWRGVPAELDEIVPSRLSEGWPLSIVEAAAFLKQRGILLALASKNDPDRAKKIWDQIYGKRFPLNNFASVKISWNSKTKSVGEILGEVNLLPENCLFVDDNPLEREQVKAAYPGISIIQGPISTWKRTLMWSPELQVPVITAEARSRTESIQKMAQREALKTEMSTEEYFESLKVDVQFDAITSTQGAKFSRVYELLNKTNQFNTTGARWSLLDIEDLFAADGRIYAATVSDRLSDYGMTALLIQKGDVCEQIVMSCRVFGLRVEHSLLAHFMATFGQGASAAKIAYKPTEKNGPSTKFLTSLGLKLDTNLGDAALYAVPTTGSQDTRAREFDISAAEVG